MGIFSKSTGGGSGDPYNPKDWEHNKDNKHKGEKPPPPGSHSYKGQKKDKNK